ncbi:MAG: hypothetical protein N2037_03970 [Acidimicrobiales bacterium]|nr:hypothetical protein [Acidimicrobiales bacterium]
MSLRRAVLFALAVVSLVGCVDRRSDRRESVAPPASVEAAVDEQQPTGIDETTARSEAPHSTGTNAPQGEAIPSGPGGPDAAGTPISAPAPSPAPAPPTTIDEYDPALVDWCASIQSRIDSAPEFGPGLTLEATQFGLEVLNAAKVGAPAQVLAALDDLIAGLEAVKAGYERGEIPDAQIGLVRWGLVNLGPERIQSLRTSFDFVFAFVNRSCLDA